MVTRPDSKVFLDGLENLVEALLVVLDHVNRTQQAFLANPNRDHINGFERSVTQIRMFSEQLERQFNRLEYLLASRRLTD